LAEPFVAKKEKCFVLLDRTAHSETILSETKRWDGGVPVQIEIVEVTRIENGIPEVSEYGSVEVV
jgi:hypothetical protein